MFVPINVPELVVLKDQNLYTMIDWFMVFNTTFITWRPVLLVDETGVP
jgi:hypothetical protein